MHVQPSPTISIMFHRSTNQGPRYVESGFAHEAEAGQDGPRIALSGADEFSEVFIGRYTGGIQ